MKLPVVILLCVGLSAPQQAGSEGAAAVGVPGSRVTAEALANASLHFRSSLQTSVTARAWHYVSRAPKAYMAAGSATAAVILLAAFLAPERWLSQGIQALSVVIGMAGYFGTRTERYQFIWSTQGDHLVTQVKRLESSGAPGRESEKKLHTLRLNINEAQARRDFTLEELAGGWKPIRDQRLRDFLFQTINALALQEGLNYTRGLPPSRRQVEPIYQPNQVLPVTMTLDPFGMEVFDPFGNHWEVTAQGVRWLSPSDALNDAKLVGDAVMRYALLPFIFDPLTRALALELQGYPVTTLNVNGLQRLYYGLEYFHTTWMTVEENKRYTYFTADGRRFRWPAIEPEHAVGRAGACLVEEDQAGNWRPVQSPAFRDYVIDAWIYAESILRQTQSEPNVPRHLIVSVGIDRQAIIVQEAGGLYVRFSGSDVAMNAVPSTAAASERAVQTAMQLAFLPALMQPLTQERALGEQTVSSTRFWENPQTLADALARLRRLYLPPRSGDSPWKRAGIFLLAAGGLLNGLGSGQAAGHVPNPLQAAA